MNRKSLVFALALVAVGFMAGQLKLNADDTKKGGEPTPEECMKMMAEYGTPGKAHEALKPWVGKWDTTSRIYMDPTQPPTETKGKAEFKWLLDGRFIHQENTGEMMGQPMNGIGISGYDNFKKKYIGMWIDSMGTAMYTFEGEADASGRTIKYSGKMDDMMTGAKDVEVRYETSIVNDNKCLFSMHNKMPDGKWMKCFEVEYNRAK